METVPRHALGRTCCERTPANAAAPRHWIAESRMEIEQARLLTLNAAHMMDTVGNKAARAEIAMIKIVAPSMACTIADWAIQMFGGGGTSSDHFLTTAYATARLLRLADGPDEVHRNQLARMELKRFRAQDPARTSGSAEVLSPEKVANRFAHLHPDSSDYLWR